MANENPNHLDFMQAAIDEAAQGRDADLGEDGLGGIPIGSVLVVDGEIIGRGHNRRHQNPQFGVILHAEMTCFANAGRDHVAQFSHATLYTTLSPCDMCTGTSLLYKIPKIVIGAVKLMVDGETFYDGQQQIEYLKQRGRQVVTPDDDSALQSLNPACRALMEDFLRTPRGKRLWFEDVADPRLSEPGS